MSLFYDPRQTSTGLGEPGPECPTLDDALVLVVKGGRIKSPPNPLPPEEIF
jgi:hypothetical protein